MQKDSPAQEWREMLESCNRASCAEELRERIFDLSCALALGSEAEQGEFFGALGDEAGGASDAALAGLLSYCMNDAGGWAQSEEIYGRLRGCALRRGIRRLPRECFVAAAAESAEAFRKVSEDFEPESGYQPELFGEICDSAMEAQKGAAGAGIAGTGYMETVRICMSLGMELDAGRVCRDAQALMGCGAWEAVVPLVELGGGGAGAAQKAFVRGVERLIWGSKRASLGQSWHRQAEQALMGLAGIMLDKREELRARMGGAGLFERAMLRLRIWEIDRAFQARRLRQAKTGISETLATGLAPLFERYELGKALDQTRAAQGSAAGEQSAGKAPRL